LISLDVTSNSNCEEDDSLVLSSIQRDGVVSYVVFSVRKNDKNSRNRGVSARDGSSIGINVVKSRLDSAANAGRASCLFDAGGLLDKSGLRSR